MENQQKGNVKVKLENLIKIHNDNNTQTGDPTIVKATFSIIDFNKSWNNQVISKEIAKQCAYTLKNKPLLCKYYPTTDYQNQDDHFGSHEDSIKKDRYGNEYVGTDTIAIGVAENEGYIGTITDEHGNEVEALLCDYVLWVSRYPDVVDLLFQMYQNNIPVYSSCEYFYSNYEVKDGVEYLNTPIYFDGHCILCSGENGSEKVDPAYDNSKLISFNKKLNKVINKAIIKNKEEKEMKDKEEMLKMYCEMSHEDIRNAIFTTLSKLMVVDEYNNIWISPYNVYDTYFIYEIYEGDNKYHYYKVEYTKTENDTVIVKLEDKQEVRWEEIWVPVIELKKVENEKKKIQKELNAVKGEKTKVENKFNEVSETLVSLNAKVSELAPLAEQYNKEKEEQKLNEKMTFYEGKFVSLNAMDKFKSDEVQNLIKKSINSKEATLELNSMLVDLVQVKDDMDITSKKTVKELNSKIGNLIPTTGMSFEERYK